MSLIQPPAQSKVHSGSDQVAQGFVQMGFENLQGWRWHNLSGKPALLLEKRFLLTSSLTLDQNV